MPKIPIDYSNCCIYKIEHIENEDLVYVGHTTNFTKRKNQHKTSSRSEKSRFYNLKLYTMIRENGGWDMFKMIEVEKYPCSDRREAERRENELMKELKSNMHIKNSFTTYEEKREYIRKYNEYNKERLKEHYKEFRENHKAQQHEYYMKNAEKFKEQSRENRKRNLNIKKKFYRKERDIMKRPRMNAIVIIHIYDIYLSFYSIFI